MPPGRIFAGLILITIAVHGITGCSNMGSGSTNEDSVNYYTQLLNQLPDDPAVYYNRGIYYFRLGKYKEAISDFSSAIRVRPGFSAAFLPRADCQRLLGNYKEASCDYDTFLVSTGGNAYVYNSRAYCYMKLKNYAAAAADYSKVIALGKASCDTYLQRGISSYKTGDYSSAATDLAMTVKMAPDSGAGYLWLANTEFRLGFFDQSISDYLEAEGKGLKLTEENHLAEAYLGRAKQQEDSDPGKALKDLNESIAVDSTNGETFFERAGIVRRLGDNESACYDYKKAGMLGYTDAFREAKTCCDPSTW